MAKKRRRRLGSVEWTNRVVVPTDLKCDKLARKILQNALRMSRPRTTCQDIVVECDKTESYRHKRLQVRAVCTSPKTRDEFVELAQGYAKSVEGML